MKVTFADESLENKLLSYLDVIIDTWINWWVSNLMRTNQSRTLSCFQLLSQVSSWYSRTESNEHAKIEINSLIVLTVIFASNLSDKENIRYSFLLNVELLWTKEKIIRIPNLRKKNLIFSKRKKFLSFLVFSSWIARHLLNYLFLEIFHWFTEWWTEQ